eukprot:TRINITY_DN82375_c0_g1_i1.p1 TRINITY_DN82375_c0_g1~~TRINITY_DN82375_c0_g1_i1.p1  ORF type:complete len:757 (+),score=116.31 TRINITY_DN82375_c0_g1_i1:54-2324(+)
MAAPMSETSEKGWFGTCKRLFRFAFPRFVDQKEEDRFRGDLTDTLCRCEICMCIAVVLILGIGIRTVFRQDNFRWSLQDPRTLYYGLHIFHIALAATIAFFILLRRRLSLKHVDWENVATVHGVLMLATNRLMSFWFIAGLYGVDPESITSVDSASAEHHSFIEAVTVLWAFAVFAPIRVCKLWVLPVTSLAAYTIFRFSVGSPQPGAVILLLPQLLVICCFAQYGAWRHEGHIRKRWLAEEQVQLQATDIASHANVKDALKAFAGAGGSDIILEMSSADFLLRNTGVMHMSFFGRQVDNLRFQDLVHEADQDRLLALLEKASKSHKLESSPMQLLRGPRSLPMQAHVMAVAIKASAANEFYMLGIKVESDLASQATDGTDEAEMAQLPSPFPAEFGKQDYDLQSQTAKSAVSSAETLAMTEIIYSEIKAAAAARRRHASESAAEEIEERLHDIAHTGFSEHWLLTSRQVNVDTTLEHGSGAYGKVYLGEFCCGTKVAVKLPKSLDQDDQAYLPSFVNELRVLRRLRHPNIVLFYGALISPKVRCLALVTEFISGKTLQQAVLGNSLPFAIRLSYANDVCKGLCYMHSLIPMVIHGDLKGSNVMVSEMQVAKLLDFGLARMYTGEKRKAAPAGGSLAYAAPEVLRCILQDRSTSLNVSASADSFSYGRVVYLIFAERKPFHQIESSLLEELVRSDSAFPELDWTGTHLAPGIKELVEGCCAQDPAARRSLQEVRETLLQHHDISPDAGTESPAQAL